MADMAYTHKAVMVGGLAVSLLLASSNGVFAGRDRSLFDGRVFNFGGINEVTQFGPDEVEGGGDDEYRFAVSVNLLGGLGDPETFIPLADDIFEDFLQYSDWPATTARVLFQYSVGEDMRTEFVNYSRHLDAPWIRESYASIPVMSSVSFPLAPVESVTLSSGEVIELYPVTSGNMRFGLNGNDERTVVHFRIAVDRDFETLSGDADLIGAIWREVLHDRIEIISPELVALAFHTRAPQSRFDFPPTVFIYFPPFESGEWLDLGILVEENRPLPVDGIGRLEW